MQDLHAHHSECMFTVMIVQEYMCVDLILG